MSRPNQSKVDKDFGAQNHLSSELNVQINQNKNFLSISKHL